ncbi:MAG: ribose-phosphate pyrophosphokinase [Puniceicoccales bacterium]|jgi:ribose-phosphate pyrophosphokinase|nr:ribose-phosphate pyrophosphokinase [Puniceicoccales bacterium]
MLNEPLLPRLKIFTGNANPALAREICKHMEVPLGAATVNCFPDGETFVKIEENIRGADVFVVQPTCHPANDHIMELLIMIDAMKRASAKRITAVIPFFGYARQDRKDQPRVPITAKLVANILTAAGTNRVLTLDLHAQQLQGFFDIPVDHLFASPVFYEYIHKKDYLKEATVFSPDIGGMKAASSFAEMLNLPLGFVAKRRMDAATVEATSLVGDVEGRNIILVDDMTETAGTLIAAGSLLKQKGAKTVRAFVSHCMLGEIGCSRLREGVIDELVTTNSTPMDPKDLPITVLSIAQLLGDAIHRIHSNESVTSLFKIKGY